MLEGGFKDQRKGKEEGEIFTLQQTFAAAVSCTFKLFSNRLVDRGEGGSSRILTRTNFPRFYMYTMTVVSFRKDEGEFRFVG